MLNLGQAPSSRRRPGSQGVKGAAVFTRWAPGLRRGDGIPLLLPALIIRRQHALAVVVASDRADHLPFPRLHSPAGNLAVEHSADEGVEAGDEVAVDRGRRVRVADA